MTEQQQIDYLKREVATLKSHFEVIQEMISYNIQIVQNVRQPYCNSCSMQMHTGFSCPREAKDCQMGVGR